MKLEDFGNFIKIFEDFFKSIEKLPPEMLAIFIPVLGFLAILAIRRVIR